MKFHIVYTKTNKSSQIIVEDFVSNFFLFHNRVVSFVNFVFNRTHRTEIFPESSLLLSSVKRSLRSRESVNNNILGNYMFSDTIRKISPSFRSSQYSKQLSVRHKISYKDIFNCLY